MRLSADDQKLLDLIVDTCSTCECSVDDATRTRSLERIKRAPLRRMRLLNAVKEDLEAGGVSLAGAINWEAIGAFIREYGDDIIKFIMTIMSLFA